MWAVTKMAAVPAPRGPAQLEAGLLAWASCWWGCGDVLRPPPGWWPDNHPAEQADSRCCQGGAAALCQVEFSAVLGATSALFAEVAHPVVVRILLIRIGGLGAIVARIAHAITV